MGRAGAHSLKGHHGKGGMEGEGKLRHSKNILAPATNILESIKVQALFKKTLV